MQSPAGNASRGLTGGPPSTVASGAGRCESGALMHSFGIFLQGLLGVVAFSTLMLKRFREPKHERRPWRIWFLDTSKQAIGMLFIHFANVYLADLTEEDPCSLTALPCRSFDDPHFPAGELRHREVILLKFTQFWSGKAGLEPSMLGPEAYMMPCCLPIFPVLRTEYRTWSLFLRPAHSRLKKYWYLINFLLDATVGMLLIYVGVRAVSVLVEWQRWESLRFGEYAWLPNVPVTRVTRSILMRLKTGDPLQCGAWVGQCALYIVIMIFEKTVVFIVLLILQWKKVALLNPIENPDLKLAIVMLIVPFFVNALMFWVVDNFLMRKGKTKAKLEERGANQDSRNGSKVRYRRAASHEESESEILISADDEMEESDMEEDLRRLTPLKPGKKKKHRFGLPV
ncbi:store-operated calcium entry regulator STIMATE isoform X1 [Heterocephalus glaber]|uniref:Store-operated calcium entry regulator STIMATE isoform X1 n=1 Tax=Heterocephalus glaber TaxID=10181 RepID=A0AAX6Q3A7_HETGA|nr:store-operated calcium entry regulator STIMATE isoform X1 [Heterocephalus glaber]